MKTLIQISLGICLGIAILSFSEIPAGPEAEPHMHIGHCVRDSGQYSLAFSEGAMIAQYTRQTGHVASSARISADSLGHILIFETESGPVVFDLIEKKDSLFSNFFKKSF